MALPAHGSGTLSGPCPERTLTAAAPRALRRAAGPGEVVAACRDLLPQGVISHRDFGALQSYLAALHPDVASFCHYIEWNLRTGALDPTFSFPTRFAGSVRLRVQELAASLAPAAPPAERGLRLLAHACHGLEALDLGAPLFPRALSVSVESLGQAASPIGVDFVFFDYGPAVDLAHDPSALARAFELLAPDDVRQPEALALLAQFSGDFGLAHVGIGWRRAACLHKVYLRGTLQMLVDAALARGAAGFVGIHAPSLCALAEQSGSRLAHLVADAEGARLTRIGFELNFDVAGAEGFVALATQSPLWQGAVGSETRREIETLAARGVARRSLADGNDATCRLSHLKLSFDASGNPEWKAYLCFQKSRLA